MKINQLLVTAGIAGILCVGGSRVLAQGGPGGGNFDPAQFQQQMQQAIMDFYRTQLEVTNDDEWSVIRGRVQKVTDARLEVGLGGMNMGMFGGMMGRGRGGGGGNGGPGGGGGRGFGALSSLFGASSPEQQALQRAIDSNASNAALKTALEKFNEARKAKQAKLEQAQTELRQVLSVRQEAIAAMSGLL